MRSQTLGFVLIGASVGVGAGALAHRFVPESPIAHGVYIGDRRVPSSGSARAWLAAQNDRVAQRIVRLRHGDYRFESTLGEAGVAIDVDATLSAAARVAHEGSIVHRLRDASRARRGQIDVPIVWKVDETRARALLDQFAAAVHSEPVDARIDLVHHEKIPDVPGQDLDVDGSIHELALGSHDDEETIDLIARGTPAKVTVADLIRVEIDKMVSSHETTFVTWGVGVGRSQNIRNAASKIDGIVLAPDELFSFNAQVGARTLANGFTWAPEIQGDEMTTGVGGGTCQVSTTLHIAALFGALSIVERQGHSHPSAYAQMGLDATVSYPSTDLKIKNTMPFPVMIHAYLPKDTIIRVELLGGDPVAKASYKYGIGHTEDFTRRIYVKDYLKPGTQIRHQKGSRGYDVSSVVTFHFFDGHTEERTYFTGYRPSPEVFWVAPGYDDAGLPPLPDHAKGVEGRMSARSADADTYPM